MNSSAPGSATSGGGSNIEGGAGSSNTEIDSGVAGNKTGRLTWHAPSNFALLTEVDLAALPGPGWYTQGGALVEDKDAPASAPWVVDYARPVGGNGGGGDNGFEGFGNTPGWDRHEVHLGFVVKLSDPYDGWLNNHQKLFRMSGTRYFVWAGVSGARDGERHFTVSLGTIGQWQVDNGHTATYEANAAEGYWKYDGGPWTAGVYHQCEIMIKPSSTGTSRDGVLRIHYDGMKTVEITDMNFPAGNEWETFNFTPAWDQPDPTQTHEDHQWWDHVRISIPN